MNAHAHHLKTHYFTFSTTQQHTFMYLHKKKKKSHLLPLLIAAKINVKNTPL